MKKAIRFILYVLLIAIILISTFLFIRLQLSYFKGEKSYSKLTQYVKKPSNKSSSKKPSGSQSNVPQGPPQEEIEWPLVDFDELLKINDDLVGWIYIEDTNVNYPIVQGPDNNFYLYKMFDGNYNRAGSIFMDSASSPDFSDRHTMIHGHHMKNDTMFSWLPKYKEQQFYDQHPMVLIMTPTQNYKLYLFSGYVTDTKSSAWKLDFSSGGFDQWLQEVSAKSNFVPNALPGSGDKIVTLATCDYDFEGARYILHGFLEGEHSGPAEPSPNQHMTVGGGVK